MGRHDSGKARRRQAILSSAGRLIATPDLSMRSIAKDAGVSQATPYNLFGSKKQLFYALYEERRLAAVRRLGEAPAGDGFDRLFTAIDLFARDLESDPDFYRPLFSVIYTAAGVGEERDRVFFDPGYAYWRDLFAAIERESLLLPGIDVEVVTRNYVYTLVGVLMDWIEHRIDAARFRDAVTYGLALSSLGICASDAAPALRARLADAEGRLASRSS